MNRLVMLAVAGLCTFTSAQAQQTAYAPTVPMVPAPTLQNGHTLIPAGANGAAGNNGGVRMLTLPRVLPLRSTTAASEPAPLMAPYSANYPLPPLPAGVGGTDGHCGTGGCRREGMNWTRLKAWLTFAPSKTELPKLRPEPYITPLQGMFPCTSPGCTGCANGHVYTGQPLPLPQPMPYPMPQPMPMPIPPAAGPVMMPPRVMSGVVVPPTWQGRTTPLPSEANMAGYRYPAVDARYTPPAARIINTSAKFPQK